MKDMAIPKLMSNSGSMKTKKKIKERLLTVKKRIKELKIEEANGAIYNEQLDYANIERNLLEWVLNKEEE